MKISIITACYNNEQTIAKTMESVAMQSYKNIEHVIIDGASKDKTLKIVNLFNHPKVISSEPDTGIYNALNKGLKLASGDIVCFLHSDDVFYSNTVLEKMVGHFQAEETLDAAYGDIVFVNQKGISIRNYSSQDFHFSDFSKGKMPAHTSFFARRKMYEAFLFNEKYRIAADFDQILRIFQSGLYNIQYFPIITTKMLTGGASTKNIQARITINKEILQSCKENGVKTNLIKVYSKYFTKIFEFKLWK